MQVDSIKTCERFQRLKLQSDEPLSNAAFDLNLRRYSMADRKAAHPVLYAAFLDAAESLKVTCGFTSVSGATSRALAQPAQVLVGSCSLTL